MTFQIVIFAVIAAVLLFQLYNVLGKKVGRQPEDNPAPVAVGPAQSAPDAQRGPVLDPAVTAAIAGLKAREPNFDPHRFLDGARQAYETIVTAYARGDRDALRPLLTDKVLASFEAGMAAREARGETETVELLHPPRADLELATAEGDRAQAKVRFLAEVRSTVTPAAGQSASDDRRTAEVWTFERRLGAADPNWSLARVEPATA
ncbi:Tim44 domain-containing protein [Brevundimonas naejangsanensis]|uniref:Tim44 domain-containing protein n=1 Tax=Brevundimonas naejangsanensis TaxID=588932 RepID=A0A494RMY4_9CAUL|nr:TIM44-related membrane protein TimA [Brevundimonas naejangsanensis]AYG96293.1 Tim44 domain-containing protein [Brevundimonas naejangsanensis]